jgi:hypothetical protein
VSCKQVPAGLPFGSYNVLKWVDAGKRKEDLAMQVKPLALGMIVMIGLWFEHAGTLSVAAQEAPQSMVLPRSFQGARLGMTLSELVHVLPDAKRVSLDQRDRAHRTVVIPSKDRYIQRVEYRFYNDQLREVAIYYTAGEIPGGLERLRARLQETYGKPAIEDQTEYDIGPNIASVKKTVWSDTATTSVLTQTLKVNQGRELYDLVVTITDHALQQLLEKDQDQYRRQELLRVPIPLPAAGMDNKQTAMSDHSGKRTSM